MVNELVIKMNVYGDAKAKELLYIPSMSLMTRPSGIGSTIYIPSNVTLTRRDLKAAGNYAPGSLIKNKDLLLVFLKPGALKEAIENALDKGATSAKDSKESNDNALANAELAISLIFSKDAKLILKNKMFTVYDYNVTALKNNIEKRQMINATINVTVGLAVNAGFIGKQRYTCGMKRNNLRQSLIQLFGYDISETRAKAPKKQIDLQPFALEDELRKKRRTQRRVKRGQYPMDMLPYMPGYEMNPRYPQYPVIAPPGAKPKRPARPINGGRKLKINSKTHKRRQVKQKSKSISQMKND